MKRFARNAALTLILITVLAVSLSLTACNTVLSEQEGRQLLSDGIAAAQASTTYYIKYKVNDNSSANGRYTQHGLNVQEGTAKFTATTGDALGSVSTDVYFGKSLKAGVSEKNAKDGDYVTGRIENDSDGNWNVTVCSLEEFLTYEDISGYNMDGIAQLIGGLSEQELQISSVTRTGKVVYIAAKVLNQDNPLSAYDSINIRVVNDKLAYIGDTKESFSISISYGGPKIVVPSWNNVLSQGE